MCVRARVRVSGGDCRFRNNVVEGKGRGNAEAEVWRGLREDIARDAGREEETGGGREMYVCGR